MNRKRLSWVNYTDLPSGELPAARFYPGVVLSEVARRSDRPANWNNLLIARVATRLEAQILSTPQTTSKTANHLISQ